MKLVKQPVQDWHQQDACRGNHHETAIQGVAACEELSGVSFHRIHGAHATEDHGCVQKGVDPGEAFEEVVAANAEQKGPCDHHKRDGEASDHPPGEFCSGQNGVVLGFEAEGAAVGHDAFPGDKIARS